MTTDALNAVLAQIDALRASIDPEDIVRDERGRFAFKDGGAARDLPADRLPYDLGAPVRSDTVEKADYVRDHVLITYMGHGGGSERDDPEFRALVAKVADTLDEMRSAGDLVVRVPPDAAEQIAREGVFKSQFESGSSMGTFAPDRRARFEEDNLGVPMDVGNHIRPIYGSIESANDAGLARCYGSVEFHLKPEVAERTTMTFGDSLASDLVAVPVTGPVDADHLLASTAPHFAQDIASALLAGRTPTGRMSGDYREIQIHGGLTTTAVDHVVINENAPYGSRVHVEPSVDDALADAGLAVSRAKAAALSAQIDALVASIDPEDIVRDERGRFASKPGGGDTPDPGVARDTWLAEQGYDPALRGTRDTVLGGPKPPEYLFARLNYGSSPAPFTDVADVMATTRDILTTAARDVDADRVVVRVPLDVASKIVEDGRIKSQFETGASRGMFSPVGRADFEADVFGIDPTGYNVGARYAPPGEGNPGFPDSERPVYASIASDFAVVGATGQYGEIGFALKGSAIRDRTTLALGDSLHEGYPIPVSIIPHAADRDLSAAVGFFGDGLIEDIHAGKPSFTYIEAQIHGGVSTSDVASVISYGPKYQDAAQAVADRLGVPLQVAPDSAEDMARVRPDSNDGRTTYGDLRAAGKLASIAPEDIVRDSHGRFASKDGSGDDALIDSALSERLGTKPVERDRAERDLPIEDLPYMPGASSERVASQAAAARSRVLDDWRETAADAAMGGENVFLHRPPGTITPPPPDWTEAEFLSKFTELLASRRSEGDLVVRVDHRDAEQVVAEGVFKSQFETGNSSGAYDPSLRATVEHANMSVPIEVGDHIRPIYGTVESSKEEANAAQSYGDVEFHLKPEVAQRSTMVFGDSLGSAYTGTADDAPVPIPMTGPVTDDQLMAALDTRGTRAYVETAMYGQPLDQRGLDYREIQVHGGLTISAVDHAVIGETNQPLWRDQEIATTLEGAGLRVEGLRPPVAASIDPEDIVRDEHGRFASKGGASELPPNTFVSKLTATWNSDAERDSEIAAFDALPASTPVLVFHGTTADNAAAIAESGSAGFAPRGDSVSGVSQSEGLYVAPTPVDAKNYAGPGGVVIAMVVPKSAIEASPEAGDKTVGQALYHSYEGAVIPTGTAVRAVSTMTVDEAQRLSNSEVPTNVAFSASIDPADIVRDSHGRFASKDGGEAPVLPSEDFNYDLLGGLDPHPPEMNLHDLEALNAKTPEEALDTYENLGLDRKEISEALKSPDPDEAYVTVMQLAHRALTEVADEHGFDHIELRRAFKGDDPLAGNQPWGRGWGLGGPQPGSGVTSWEIVTPGDSGIGGYGKATTRMTASVDQVIGRLGIQPNELLVARDPAIVDAIMAWPSDLNGVETAPFSTFPERAAAPRTASVDANGNIHDDTGRFASKGAGEGTPALIVDRDGTLASVKHVAPKGNDRKQWDEFNASIPFDAPVPKVVKMIEKWKADNPEGKVVMVTGRAAGNHPADFRTFNQMRDWVTKHDLPIDRILMRRGGDMRPDHVIKQEILDTHLGQYNILGVIDDRQSVIDMWKSNGLKVTKVTDPGIDPPISRQASVLDTIDALVASIDPEDIVRDSHGRFASKGGGDVPAGITEVKGSHLNRILTEMGALPGRDYAKEREIAGKYGERTPVRIVSLRKVQPDDYGSGEGYTDGVRDGLKPMGGMTMTEEPEGHPPDHLFRAVSEEDWQNIVHTGEMRSDGRMNLGAYEGTVAEEGSPTFYLPGGLASDDQTKEYTGRIVRIKFTDEDGWYRDGDGYPKTNQPIPLDHIDMVSEPITKLGGRMVSHQWDHGVTGSIEAAKTASICDPATVLGQDDEVADTFRKILGLHADVVTGVRTASIDVEDIVRDERGRFASKGGAEVRTQPEGDRYATRFRAFSDIRLDVEPSEAQRRAILRGENDRPGFLESMYRSDAANRSAISKALKSEDPDPGLVAVLQLAHSSAVRIADDNDITHLKLERGTTDHAGDPDNPFTGNERERYGSGWSIRHTPGDSGVTSWTVARSDSVSQPGAPWGSHPHEATIPIEQIVGRLGYMHNEMLVARDPKIVDAIMAWPEPIDGVPTAPFNTFPERSAVKTASIDPADIVPVSALAASIDPEDIVRDDRGRFASKDGGPSATSPGGFATSGEPVDASVDEHLGLAEFTYGDMAWSTEIPGSGAWDEAYSAWSSWDGNYDMRHASAALMGEAAPASGGSDMGPSEVHRIIETGVSEGQPDWAIAQAQDGVRQAYQAMSEIRNSGVATELPAYRGMANLPASSSIFDLKPGDTFVAPLTAFSPNIRTAQAFMTPEGATGGTTDAGSVMVVLRPGAIVAKAPEGYEDNVEVKGEWVIEPVEYVTDGEFSVAAVRDDPKGYRVIELEHQAVVNPNDGSLDSFPNRMAAVGVASRIPDWIWLLAGPASVPVNPVPPKLSAVVSAISALYWDIEPGDVEVSPHTAAPAPTSLNPRGRRRDTALGHYHRTGGRWPHPTPTKVAGAYVEDDHPRDSRGRWTVGGDDIDTGPLGVAVDVRDSYLAGRKGHTADELDRVEADSALERKIADAYEAMPSRSDDPETVRAYTALRDEVNAQYDHMVASGIKVEFTMKDPYRNVDELAHDVSTNHHLAVLATAATGGHPFFTDTENDRFRAVHDFYGHAASGRGFDRHGEEAAFLSHSDLFSPLATRALATETRGQNSVLNFGPRPDQFPEQKFALLPESMSDPSTVHIADHAIAASIDPADIVRDDHGRFASKSGGEVKLTSRVNDRPSIHDALVSADPLPATVQSFQQAHRELIAQVGSGTVQLHRNTVVEQDPFVGNVANRFGPATKDPNRSPVPTSGVTSWATGYGDPHGGQQLYPPELFGSFPHAADIPSAQIIGRAGRDPGEFLVARDPKIVDAIMAWPAPVDGVPTAPFNTFPERHASATSRTASIISGIRALTASIDPADIVRDDHGRFASKGGDVATQPSGLAINNLIAPVMTPDDMAVLIGPNPAPVVRVPLDERAINAYKAALRDRTAISQALKAEDPDPVAVRSLRLAHEGLVHLAAEQDFDHLRVSRGGDPSDATAGNPKSSDLGRPTSGVTSWMLTDHALGDSAFPSDRVDSYGTVHDWTVPVEQVIGRAGVLGNEMLVARDPKIVDAIMSHPAPIDGVPTAPFNTFPERHAARTASIDPEDIVRDSRGRFASKDGGGPEDVLRAAGWTDEGIAGRTTDYRNVMDVWRGYTGSQEIRQAADRVVPGATLSFDPGLTSGRDSIRDEAFATYGSPPGYDPDALRDPVSLAVDDLQARHLLGQLDTPAPGEPGADHWARTVPTTTYRTLTVDATSHAALMADATVGNHVTIPLMSTIDDAVIASNYGGYDNGLSAVTLRIAPGAPGIEVVKGNAQEYIQGGTFEVTAVHDEVESRDIYAPMTSEEADTWPDGDFPPPIGSYDRHETTVDLRFTGPPARTAGTWNEEDHPRDDHPLYYVNEGERSSGASLVAPTSSLTFTPGSTPIPLDSVPDPAIVPPGAVTAASSKLAAVLGLIASIDPDLIVRDERGRFASKGGGDSVTPAPEGTSPPLLRWRKGSGVAHAHLDTVERLLGDPVAAEPGYVQKIPYNSTYNGPDGVESTLNIEDFVRFSAYRNDPALSEGDRRFYGARADGAIAVCEDLERAGLPSPRSPEARQAYRNLADQLGEGIALELGSSPYGYAGKLAGVPIAQIEGMADAYRRVGGPEVTSQLGLATVSLSETRPFSGSNGMAYVHPREHDSAMVMTDSGHQFSAGLNRPDGYYAKYRDENPRQGTYLAGSTAREVAEIITVHEIGHLIHAQAIRSSGLDVTDNDDDPRKFVDTMDADARRRIEQEAPDHNVAPPPTWTTENARGAGAIVAVAPSKYGSSDTSEYVAEAFAMAVTGARPTPLNKDLVGQQNESIAMSLGVADTLWQSVFPDRPLPTGGPAPSLTFSLDPGGPT